MGCRVLGLVMAGGKGERLFPLTRDRAKPAVPFGGIYRIIDFVLSNFVNSGIRSLFVLTQFKSQSLTEHILQQLENRYGIEDRSPSLPERVKACRRHAIQLMEDDTLSEQEHADAKIDLDDLFVVTQLFSYPGTYVSKRPSIEDMAEMLDKFEEDVLKSSTATVRGTRRAVIEFGEPIPVESDKGGKTQIHALTEKLEQNVQAMLDNLQTV